MLSPVGRLPSQVYWRRRVVLVGFVLVAALLAGWFLLGGDSGASGDADSAASQTTAAATSAQPSGQGGRPGLEEVVPPLIPAAPDESGAPGGSGAPGESGAPGGSGAPAGAPAPAPDPGAAPGPAPPGAPAPPAPPAEPGPCPDEAIGLAVGAEFGSYAAGSKPVLGLNVTNLSPVPCYRDLDLALQTWGLFAADGTRLWGSNDCYPEPSVANSQLLAPGQVVTFTIVWSGLTSEPTCTVPRQVLGPGTYQLRGYLGNLVSPFVPLVLT